MGPFSARQMDHWFDKGHLNNYILIKHRPDQKFQRLCNLLFEWTDEPYVPKNRYQKPTKFSGGRFFNKNRGNYTKDREQQRGEREYPEKFSKVEDDDGFTTVGSKATRQKYNSKLKSPGARFIGRGAKAKAEGGKVEPGSGFKPAPETKPYNQRSGYKPYNPAQQKPF
jgi:hypothetical protein